LRLLVPLTDRTFAKESTTRVSYTQNWYTQIRVRAGDFSSICNTFKEGNKLRNLTVYP